MTSALQENETAGVLAGGKAPRRPPPAPSDEEDKNAADAPLDKQKKKRERRAGKEGRDTADGQDRNQKEEHAEKQKDTRKEAKAVSEKKMTENVLGEGTGERPPFKDPTFKDLKSVFEFSDDFFIGKACKKVVHILYFVQVQEAMESVALFNFSSLSDQMDCLADSLHDRFFKGECHCL